MANMYIANNYLESCKGWQEVINAQASAEAQMEAATAAQKALGKETFYDCRHVIVRGEVALFVPDNSDPLEEQVWPLVQFDQIATRGWLGRPSLVKIKSNTSLTWPIFDPSVIGLRDELGYFNEVAEPLDEDDLDSTPYPIALDKPLRRTLHFPVSLINYALCYQR